MAEDLIKINGTRADQYVNLYPQIQSLLAGETDLYANLANIAAAMLPRLAYRSVSPANKD